QRECVEGTVPPSAHAALLLESACWSVSANYELRITGKPQKSWWFAHRAEEGSLMITFRSNTSRISIKLFINNGLNVIALHQAEPNLYDLCAVLRDLCGFNFPN